MQSLQSFEDAMGRPSDVFAPAGDRRAVLLTRGVPKTVAVPPGAVSVLFNATGPFWVQYGAPAVLPAADDLGGSAPDLSPAARRIKGLSVLGLVAPEDCAVSLCFFG